MPSAGGSGEYDPRGIEYAVGSALHAQLPKAFEQALRSEVVAPLLDRISNLERLLIEHLQRDRDGECPSCRRQCSRRPHAGHARGDWASSPSTVAKSNVRCSIQDVEADRWVPECGPVCEALESGGSDWQQQPDADGDIIPGKAPCPGSGGGAEHIAVTDEETEVLAPASSIL